MTTVKKIPQKIETGQLNAPASRMLKFTCEFPVFKWDWTVREFSQGGHTKHCREWNTWTVPGLREMVTSAKENGNKLFT